MTKRRPPTATQKDCATDVGKAIHHNPFEHGCKLGIAKKAGQLGEQRRKRLFADLQALQKKTVFDDGRMGKNLSATSAGIERLKVLHLSSRKQKAAAFQLAEQGHKEEECLPINELQASDVEDDEVEGILKLNFGKGSEDEIRGKSRSRREVYKEIIKKSKLAKVQRQQEKAQLEDRLSRLDSGFQELRSKLATSIQSPTACSLLGPNSWQVPVDDPFGFDALAHRLQSERRIVATERMKTVEELQQEKNLQLRSAELSRQERLEHPDYGMHISDDSANDERIEDEISDVSSSSDDRSSVASGETGYFAPRIECEQEHARQDKQGVNSTVGSSTSRRACDLLDEEVDKLLHVLKTIASLTSKERLETIRRLVLKVQQVQGSEEDKNNKVAATVQLFLRMYVAIGCLSMESRQGRKDIEVHLQTMLTISEILQLQRNPKSTLEALIEAIMDFLPYHAKAASDLLRPLVLLIASRSSSSLWSRFHRSQLLSHKDDVCSANAENDWITKLLQGSKQSPTTTDMIVVGITLQVFATTDGDPPPLAVLCLNLLDMWAVRISKLRFISWNEVPAFSNDCVLQMDHEELQVGLQTLSLLHATAHQYGCYSTAVTSLGLFLLKRSLSRLRDSCTPEPVARLLTTSVRFIVVCLHKSFITMKGNSLESHGDLPTMLSTQTWDRMLTPATVPTHGIQLQSSGTALLDRTDSLYCARVCAQFLLRSWPEIFGENMWPFDREGCLRQELAELRSTASSILGEKCKPITLRKTHCAEMEMLRPSYVDHRGHRNSHIGRYIRGARVLTETEKLKRQLNKERRGAARHLRRDAEYVRSVEETRRLRHDHRIDENYKEFSKYIEQDIQTISQLKTAGGGGAMDTSIRPYRPSKQRKTQRMGGNQMEVL